MQPSLAVSAAFLAIVASLLALLAASVRQAELRLGAAPARARRQALVATACASAWLAVTFVLAASGFLADFEARPPRLLFAFPPALAACLVIALGSAGGRLARGLPVALLVGFQCFRVPVELVLHRLATEGVLPERMTYEGANFDILTGLAALPVAWLAWRDRLPRWGLVLFNVAGLALLATIVTIAILSMPYGFRHFQDGPANAVVFSWPFIWLPAFVVPAALFGHVLSLRQAFAPERPVA